MSNYRYELGGIIRDLKCDIPYPTDEIVDLLEEKDQRIKELEEENQRVKDQVKKSYQEGLLQKQFDKDMEIQELKDKIEFLTTFKEVISEYKPAFCKLAGRDCEWLGKEKQLAIEELEKVSKHFVYSGDEMVSDYDLDCYPIELKEEIERRIKELKGEK